MVSAALEGVNLGRVLLDLTIILLVAKLAAEASDRIRIPAVIGEIAAGIVIGPSVLGLVSGSDMLFVLAEFGVIFLLIQVGMETDIAELRSVGRASMLVALIGVALPMALGVGVGLAIGESTNTSLFIGAALTATSIGITARVFGDLRALATVEARTVLGAAVVDDVLGLIILTVVVRIVEQGSVGIGTVATTIGLAVGFLLLTSVIGFATFPKVFATIAKHSRSTATVSVTAIGVALAFSVLADKANLAPIIGAFVAGLALRRISASERVERDVASLGHIFVPVFFLYIGITTDIQAMFDARVLGIALLLSAVAIIGKIAAAVGAFGTKSDKLVIGFGMLPRGEVGLIFATIGLKVGALSEEMYGSILFVVLLTTLLAPPLLRWRLGKESVVVEDAEHAERPANGWVDVQNGNIEFNTRKTSTSTSPFLKLYDKELEAIERKNEFFDTYFNVNDLRNLKRIEATLKSTKEVKQSLNLETSNLVSLLNSTPGELNEVISNAVNINLKAIKEVTIKKSKVERSNNLDKMIYIHFANMLDNQNLFFEEALAITLEHFTDKQNKFRIKKKIVKIYSEEIAEIEHKKVNLKRVELLSLIGWGNSKSLYA